MPPKNYTESADLLREVLRWMDAHEDVLPAIRHGKGITPEEVEQTALRIRYDWRLRSTSGNAEEKALLQEIRLRQTKPAHLQTLSEVTEWAGRHGGRLPLHARDDLVQYALAQKMRRIQTMQHKPPAIQNRLLRLNAISHETPTKVTL